MPFLKRDTAPSDLLASIVVFLVALPLCLGIAIASGAPPAAGLITGVIGGLVVGSVSGSPLLVSGPAAGLAVLVYQIIQEHGMAGLGAAVLLGGGLQVVAGWARMGQWFRAMSPAVIYGMLAGIGVLIFAAQFHVMVDDLPRESGLANIIEIPKAVVLGLGGTGSHQAAAIIGTLTLAVLIAWNSLAPGRIKWVPSALVAVVVATAAAALAGLDIKYVQLPENLLGDASFVSIEGLSLLGSSGVLIAACTVAFVASAETLLSAAAVDRMHDGPRTRYDRELMAQGLGNMLCGALGALPMTGVIVRSATNVNAGARTRLSTVLHGTWILVFVLAFPHLLRLIPTASLAAVLVYTGYKLIDPKNIRRLAAYGRMPVVIYFATLAVIVVEDLLVGILVGLALSAIQSLYRLSHFDVDVRPQGDREVHVHLTGAATFMQLPKLLASLEALPANCAVHVHVHQVAYLDDAVLETLAGWEKQRRLQGCETVRVEWDRLIGIYRQRHHADEGQIRRLLASQASAAH
jgi:MFS superfamily sulfate permease-like transporter